ncbi:MAG TPA: HlyD family efflux transporter periplasmic adaptor subunit [Arachnia sp.]|nr:HlyD family efflux transporter periplasmic adaptor subunit [Arachnia sp.]HMT87192.1 HlyD family efflux transporter periplasmic adaptor subunit [Arachnia sp.]
MIRPSAVALAAVATLALSGCQQAASGTITATGRVLAASVSVQAPVLSVPQVSLDAGFRVAPDASASASPVPSLLSFGAAQRVAAVEVRVGDRVEEGDVLLRFDDDALGAQVQVAEADAALAAAQVGLIDAGIVTAHDTETDLNDKRTEIADALAKGTNARADLIAKRDEARTAKAKLPEQLATVENNLAEQTAALADTDKQLARVREALAALPENAPPENRDPLLQAERQLSDAVSQLTDGVARLNAARGEIIAAQAQLTKAIDQLTDGIATADANLAKARDGLQEIDDGLAELGDARTALNRNRKLAVVAAEDAAPVRAAKLAKEKAIVRAPSDGVVTTIAHAGDVLAPGATVATIARPALVVRTWLAPEEAARVCEAAEATVVVDSLPEPLSGRISRILPLAEYPPSHHATDQVHLTRAVPVEVTVSSSALPPGVPADLQLSSCRAKG